METAERILSMADSSRRQPVSDSVLMLCLIGALFAGAVTLVYSTGGTKLAWPYLTLIPVLISAARFRVLGGLLGGLVGGLLLGPYMPLDVDAGIAQETGNWLIRLAFYTGLGGFAGLLFLNLHRESERRAREARTDRDSGLPNKVALVESLNDDRRASARAPVLFLLRVNDLAGIVQALGVSAGDELMRALAARARKHIAEPLKIYRFSASELMLVQPAPTRASAHLAGQIVESVEHPIEVHGIPVHADITLGCTGDGPEFIEPQELIRRARVALLEAQHRANGICSYEPVHERESTQTIALLGQVRSALEAGEFELHYQPKIRAGDDTVTGCEALIRWRRDGRLIPPGQFMPGVERSALISPLTRFVIESGSRFASRLAGQSISINFTARNLLDRELIAHLERVVDAHDIPRGNIEIELTESAIIADPEAARSAIAQLRERGFRISIDDFGTGYSSFEYLRLLPITGLKVDRAFVIDLESDARARELMNCMIQVGHALHLEVTVEGVETARQLEILRKLDCDLIQGFHFSPPMADDRYHEWCRQYGN